MTHCNEINLYERERTSTQTRQTVIDETVLGKPITNNSLVFPTSGFSRVIFVEDISGSMSEPCDPNLRKIEAAQQSTIAAIGMIVRSAPDDSVALLTFNGSTKVACDFVNVEAGYSQLLDAIQSMTAGGNTNIPRALNAAYDLLRSGPSGQEDRVVLLTDGHGGDGKLAAEQIKQLGATIYVIGFGQNPSDVNEAMLRRVASQRDGQPLYEFATTPQGLTTTVIQAVRQ